MCDTLLRSFPSQQGLKLGGRPALSLRRCSATIPGLSLLPKGEKRRGHEDRGISTCSDTYKQGEGEILKGRTAKEQYSAYWEQRGQRSVDGPSERLANGHIHHIGVGFPLHQHGILPHPIEHDDRGDGHDYRYQCLLASFPSEAGTHFLHTRSGLIRTKLCIQITQHRLVLSLAQCLSLYQVGIVSNRLDGCSRHTICFHNLPNLVNAGGLVQLDFRPHTTLELNAQAYARTNDHNQSEQQDGQE